MVKECSSFKIKYTDSSCLLVVPCISLFYFIHTAKNLCPSPLPRAASQVCLYLIVFITWDIYVILIEQVTHMRSWFSLNNYYCNLLFIYLPLVRLMSGCRDIIVSPPFCALMRNLGIDPKNKGVAWWPSKYSRQVTVLMESFDNTWLFWKVSCNC